MGNAVPISSFSLPVPVRPGHDELSRTARRVLPSQAPGRVPGLIYGTSQVTRAPEHGTEAAGDVR